MVQADKVVIKFAAYCECGVTGTIRNFLCVCDEGCECICSQCLCTQSEDEEDNRGENQDGTSI